LIKKLTMKYLFKQKIDGSLHVGTIFHAKYLTILKRECART
jgi:hypothetical protein